MTTTSFDEDSSSIERGRISIWSGLLSDIPDGWVICDGNNGTPNLLDDFILPPDSYSDGSGGTRGQKSVNLSSGQLPSHGHSATIGSQGDHRHAITGFAGGSGSETSFENYDGYSDKNTSSNGGHSHGGGQTNDSGSGSSIDNQPQHYEVAFIYKT